MGMMLKNLVHPYIQSTTVLCDNVLWECKHFDRSLHVGSLDPTSVQNFRPIPLMVFEILGFKLKNKNDNDKKKNWRNGPFAVSLMLVVQF